MFSAFHTQSHRYRWENIPPEEIAEFVVPHSHEEHRKHYIEYCPVCGRLSWAVSEKSDSLEVVISQATQTCVLCQEVHRRSPELAIWVMTVVNHALLSYSENGKGEWPNL